MVNTANLCHRFPILNRNKIYAVALRVFRGRVTEQLPLPYIKRSLPRHAERHGRAKQTNPREETMKGF